MRIFNDNESCPCGSEHKYKDCCNNKGFLEIFKTHRQSAERIKKFEDCCAPESGKHLCGKNDDGKTKIINAHTVTKNKSLKHIASQSRRKVYHFRDEHNYFLKDPFILKPVGIKSASVFKGFCSYHDNDLFECIEKNNEFAATSKQIFFLSFRAIAKHHSVISCTSKGENFFHLLVNKYLPAIDNWFLSEYEITRLMDFRRHTIASYNEFEHTRKVCAQYITRFHKSIDQQNYNGLDHYIFEIKGIFPIQCCGCCSPVIVNPYSKSDPYPLKFFFINYFYEELTQRSYAAFSWFKEDIECEQYIYQNFISDNNKAVLYSLIVFNFNSIDNFFIQQSWWDRLSNSSKEFFESTLNTFSIENNIDIEKQIKTYNDLKRDNMLDEFSLHRHGKAEKYCLLSRVVLRILRLFHNNIPMFKLNKKSQT